MSLFLRCCSARNTSSVMCAPSQQQFRHFVKPSTAFGTLESDPLYYKLLSRCRPAVLSAQQEVLDNLDKRHVAAGASRTTDDTTRTTSILTDQNSSDTMKPSQLWRSAFEAAVARPISDALSSSSSSPSSVLVCQLCQTPLVMAEEGVAASLHPQTNRHVICSGLLDRMLVANHELEQHYGSHQQLPSSRGNGRRQQQALESQPLRLWRAELPLSTSSSSVTARTPQHHMHHPVALHDPAKYTPTCAAAMRHMTPMQRMLCLPLEWGERLMTSRRRQVREEHSTQLKRCSDDDGVVLGSLPIRLEPLRLSWFGAVIAFVNVHSIVRMTPNTTSAYDCFSKVFSDPRWPGFAAQYASTIGTQLDMNILKRRIDLFARIGLFPVTFAQLSSSADSDDVTSDSVRGLLFERLECIGDHNFGSESSGRLSRIFSNEDMTHTMNSVSFDELRCASEGGHNMGVLAEQLNLIGLIVRSRGGVTSTKLKYRSDLLECLLAELRLAAWATTPIDHGSGSGCRYRSISASGSSESALRRIDATLEDTLQLLMDMFVLTLVTHGHASRVEMLFRLDRLFDAGVHRLSLRKSSLPSGARGRSGQGLGVGGSAMLPGVDAEQLLSMGSPIQVAQSPDFHEVSKKRYSFAGGTRVGRLVMLPPWLPLAGTAAAQHSRVAPFERRVVKADWRGSVATATCCLLAYDDPICEALGIAPSSRLADAK